MFLATQATSDEEPEWRRIVASAVMLLSSIRDSIMERKVTPKQLQVFSEQAFKPLWNAYFKLRTDQHQHHIVKRIEKMGNELKYFQSYKQKVLSFLEFLKEYPIQG